MKRSSVPGLKVAMEFESLIAQGDGKKDAVSPKLYAVEGVSGVFKRVPRSGRGIDAPKDAVLCSFEGSIIELVMAEEVMEELAEALFPLKGDDTAHVAHLLDRRDNVRTEGILKRAFAPESPIREELIDAFAIRQNPNPHGDPDVCGTTIRMADGKAEEIIAPIPDGYRVTSFFGVADLGTTSPIAYKLCNDIPLSAEDLDTLKAASKKPTESASCPNPDPKTERASTPETPMEPSATSAPPRTPRPRPEPPKSVVVEKGVQSRQAST